MTLSLIGASAHLKHFLPLSNRTKAWAMGTQRKPVQEESCRVNDAASTELRRAKLQPRVAAGIFVAEKTDDIPGPPEFLPGNAGLSTAHDTHMLMILE